MHTKKQILLIIYLVSLIGIVSAIPSMPHTFRGTAEYSNGQPIQDGYIVTAKLDDQPINTSSVIKDGIYGYEDPLLVSNIIGNGEKVYFYINGELVENNPIDFIIGGFTELNLTTNLTNPNSPSENNDSSSSTSSKSSGGSGASGSSTDGIINLDYKTGSLGGISSIKTNESSEKTSSGITGYVINFIGSGKVAITFISLIGILILLLLIKKYKK